MLTDGSKLNGRAGASFYIEYTSGSHTDQNFFHLGRYRTVFQAEVFAIAEIAKKLIMDRIVNEIIIILVDSQAAILAIQNNIVKSNTGLTCIKILNILGKDNDVTIAWTPGHTGIQGNERADILAKSGSALNCSGPEPFISIPYASCRAAIKDWSVKRWKTSWIERKDCLRTKENVGWTSPQLTQRLLRLKRPRINEVLQVLSGPATYRNTGAPWDMTYHRHVQNVTWKKKLQITMLENALTTKPYERRFLVKKKPQ